ncbi:PREDICTED: nucleoporin Nup43 [Ficedula albicollis]|uniref:nucleoporin Nup43 n=1 Tax=Ficedula albicollis TaxID=59894 RepID=UPI00035A1CD9|nr:PREDICTED: nucleoporin Nup43 [Ficedula albicollis]
MPPGLHSVCDILWYGTSQFGSAVLAVLPPGFSSTCSPAERGLKRSPLGVSAAQQRVTRRCRVNVILTLNPKHSAAAATRKNINAAPAERKPWGRPAARQRYPPGQALPSGRRRLPQGRCAARSLLPSLAEAYCEVLSTAFSSKCGIVSVQDNRVSIWSAGDLGNAGLNGEYHGEPHLLCDIQHNGDVMDMQFLDQERLVVASSTGTVTIFRHHQNNQTLSANHRWEKAHYHVDQDTSCGGAACTGVVCNNPEIVTVGEDGRINLFRADQRDAVRTIDNADSSTLHAVTFLRTTEILTVNSIGQLKIWDLRQQRNEPSQIFSLAGDRVPLHCVDRHPNQQHIVATGGQDGMLSIWDIRQGTMPVSLLNAHEAEMWEVHFHPSDPDHLFTCSEDGSLWHWDTSTNVSEKPSFLHQGGRSTAYLSHSTINQSVVSAWLSNDPTKDRMEITNLIPNQTLSVNSLDVLGPCLVYGTDAEAIYVNRQLFA